MSTSIVGAGLTGSYIFSQTVFSLRGGVTTRLQGFVIAGIHQLTLWAVPQTSKHRILFRTQTLDAVISN